MVIKSLWLYFCQFTTLLLSIFFIISTLKPHWINNLDNLFSKNPMEITPLTRTKVNNNNLTLEIQSNSKQNNFTKGVCDKIC
jgi:hypothetical protein